MATRYCPRCGNDIPSDVAQFCARCGERLEPFAPALEPPSPPQPLPVSQPVQAPPRAYEPRPQPYQPQPMYQPAPAQQHVSVNVQQAPITMNTVVMVHNSGPNILVRLLWFVFLGLWLGAIATFWGYLLCLTIIGLPLGLAVLNRLPSIMTLRPASNNVRITTSGTTTLVQFGGAPQVNFLIRTAWYFLVGWWFGFIWLMVAWLVAIFWILPPFMILAFWMFDRVPAVMTLRRN